MLAQNPRKMEVFDYVLEVKDLSVIRSGKLVISDIDLKISKGEFVGIAGPNGSGKTTLLLSILGILEANSGRVRIYGCEPMCRSNDGRISWVSQAASNLPNNLRITVRELVKLGAISSRNMFFPNRNRINSIVDKAIEMVELKDVEHTDVARLSGGQRQRAVIARALASEADFIILDEPLVGIDREARSSLLKLLDGLCHDAGKTILMVSHDLAAILQTAHRMIYLEESIKFDGETSEFPELTEIAELRGIKPVHDESGKNQQTPELVLIREEM
tara:strand:+ start:1033 stop:1854 length:822 start_codon:yes stop_codon:yes gene_type:complete